MPQARSYAGHHATAQRAQRTEALLDVDGRKMAEGERTNQLLLRVLILLCIDRHRVGGTDALVARTAVAHHGNHCASHACVAGEGRLTDDMAEDGVTEDAVTQRTVDGLA